MSATETPLDVAVIDGAVKVLSIPGVWAQGNYDRGGRVCAHGAVLRQHCTPGDEHMWRAVMWSKGLTERWNDETGRTVDQVISRFAEVRDATEADMEATFGTQWRAVRDMIRRAAVLTPDEADALSVANPHELAWSEALDAIFVDPLEPVWSAISNVILKMLWHSPAAYTVRAAALALSMRDTLDPAHYRTITQSWADVIGPAHPDDPAEVTA